MHVLAEPAALELKPPPADVWAWWKNARYGRFGPFDPLAPQQGLYRFQPRKSERAKPARIWWCPEDRMWNAEVFGQDFTDVAYVWRWSHQNPVSKSVFDQAMKNGDWPEDTGPVMAKIGHNSGQPQDTVRDEIASADAAFKAWLAERGGVIRSEEDDTTAEAYRRRFLEFRKRIETAHADAKAPILAQGKAIDAAWISGPTSVKAYAQTCQDAVGVAVTAYRVERKRIADEEATKAKAAREAELQAARQRTGADRSSQAPLPPLPSAKPSGLRKVETAIIDDAGEVAAYLVKLGNPEHLDLLRRLALRMLKAGVVVPGARLETSLKA